MSRVASAALFALSVAAARAATLDVPADANLYGAGHAAAPEPAGYGAGSLPPSYSFTAGPGQTLTVGSVTGCIALTVSMGGCNGGDGSTLHVYPTGITSYGGISGISDDTNGFLAAVFLDDTEPVDPAPSSLDFRSGALGTAFPTLSPVIGQAFFVGDGVTGTASGATQSFSVPPTATRLFFGFADGYSYSGPPGAYGDNDGTLTATFDITGGCRPDVTSFPPNPVICTGQPATLDASGMTLAGCAAATSYEWSDPSGVIASAPVFDVTPASTTSYTVTLTCPTDPTCSLVIGATVTVEEPPIFAGATARDVVSCGVGIDVSWPAATFGSGAGTYSVYRSEISCADALLHPPLAVGWGGTSFYDDATADGVTYIYVIVAEDAVATTACANPGPANGGATTSWCAPPVTEVAVAFTPFGACGVLRASHAGDDVTLEWATLRALRPDEHVHLLWSADDARGPFVRVTPEGDRGLAFTHVDTTTPLQFFDLRVANDCEVESTAEYPAPGLLDRFISCP